MPLLPAFLKPDRHDRCLRLLLWTTGLTGAVHVLACVSAWHRVFLGPLAYLTAMLFAASGVVGAATLLLGLVRRVMRSRIPLWKRASMGVAIAASMGMTAALVSMRFSPCENIMGNHDQGMYLAAGGHLARTGSLRIELPELSLLGRDERDVFVQPRNVEFMRGSDPRQNPPQSFGVGFPLEDQDALLGPAVPHFPAGFAVLIASAFKVGGWAAAQPVSVFCIATGIVFMGVFSLRQFGFATALLLPPLLAAHPLLSWLSDRHYAEAPLFMVTAMLLASLPAAPRHPRLAGTTAASLLAMSLTFKIDALVLLPVMCVALLLSRAPRSFKTSFVASSLLLLPTALGLNLVQSGLYLAANARALAAEPLFVAVSAVVLLILPLSYHWLSRLHVHTSRVVWQSSLAAAACLLVVFYLFRTNPDTPDTYFNPAISRTIRSFREDTLARLDWYWTPFGFLPALACAVVACWRRRSLATVFFATAGLATLVAIGYDVRCDPTQPFCMRRLTAFALPWLLVGVAAAPSLARSRPLRLAGLALPVAFIIGQSVAQARIRSQPEFPGTWAFTEVLAHSIPSRSVVIISERSPMAPLSLPLRAFWGVNTFSIGSSKDNAREGVALKTAIARWTQKGFHVFFLGNDPAEAVQRGLSPKPVSTLQWETLFQLGSYDSAAGPLRTIGWNVQVLEVGAPTSSHARLPGLYHQHLSERRRLADAAQSLERPGGESHDAENQ